ncbi:MAG: hypothetical protein Q4D53_02050 [Leptotrichiaceae bacterium]|nr:hypothetical protein [Leptotrichiaceae bacterium]
MSVFTLNINSENYDYTMLDNTYKKLSDWITEVKFDFKNNTADITNVIEGTFLMNVSGNNIKIKSGLLLHLLLFTYFTELESSEDEKLYRAILNNFVRENAERYERRVKKVNSGYSENENREKVYKFLKDIFRVSENVFELIVSSVGKNRRGKILKKSVQTFNLYNRELNRIVLEKNRFDIKMEKCYDEIEKIFKTVIIRELEEYNAEETDNGGYLLRIVKDGIKAVYTCIILERIKSENSFEIFFNSDVWFIYFYSLLLSNYRENKSNLLKLNKNTDFLKFGADTHTVNGAVKIFTEKNNMKETERGLKPKIFYLLLAKGYYDRSIYSADSIDENCIFEINFTNESGDEIFEEGLKIYKLNTNFIISEFVNMLLMTDNRNLRKYIAEFVEKFNTVVSQYNNFEDVSEDVEYAMSNIFSNLEENMTERYNEIKRLYDTGSKGQKIAIIKEIINILIQKMNINLNSKKNIIRNYKLAIEYLKNIMNCEVQIYKDMSFGNSVFITHNIIDSIRFENEKTAERILKTDFKTVEELVSKYPSDIEKVEGEKNKSVETFKEELINKYTDKSRILIKVNTEINMDGQDDTSLHIHMKIFFLMTIYNKIKSSDYFLGLNEKFKKIYLNIITDVIYMLNLKDNLLIRNLPFIKEYDYLEDFFKKTESYFFSLYLNNEENIRKINRETVKEAEEYLEVFRNALTDSYCYYEENYDGLRTDGNISEEREEASDPFIEKNRNISDKDIKNTADYLIRSFDLNEIFV